MDINNICKGGGLKSTLVPYVRHCLHAHVIYFYFVI